MYVNTKLSDADGKYDEVDDKTVSVAPKQDSELLLFAAGVLNMALLQLSATRRIHSTTMDHRISGILEPFSPFVPQSHSYRLRGPPSVCNHAFKGPPKGAPVNCLTVWEYMPHMLHVAWRLPDITRKKPSPGVTDTNKPVQTWLFYFYLRSFDGRFTLQRTFDCSSYRCLHAARCATNAWSAAANVQFLKLRRIGNS